MTKITRSFRFRLYPTAEQEQKIVQIAGATRFVYNLALEQRRVFGRRGRSFNFVNQGREVTQLRHEIDWLSEIPTDPLIQALRDLDRAYANFFSRRADYPSPRRRGVNDSFRVKSSESAIRHLSARWSSVRVPRLGFVKFRDTRPMRGRWTNVTISLRAGQWFASFAYEVEHEAQPSILPSVGIDRGIANTIALSNGELLSIPSTKHLERHKMKAQRILSRRKRGSVRYRKQRRHVARLAAKISRIRTDWRHKVTTGIVRRFGTVAIEDLNTKGMTRAGNGKRGLNRSILEQGWGAFETVLAYKLVERGGTLIKVNPAYTSQTCSACGTIDKASRENQASFACRHCGFTVHADTNAAINIQRRSTALLPVEACGCAADEAGTINHALAA